MIENEKKYINLEKLKLFSLEVENKKNKLFELIKDLNLKKKILELVQQLEQVR